MILWYLSVLLVYVYAVDFDLETDVASERQPSEPLDVEVLNVTDTTSTALSLSWSPPEFLNGVISGYRVYYMCDGHTDVQSSASSSTKFLLINLKPYTEYTIWVTAYTAKFEGKASEPIHHRTDITGPHSPAITNITCQSNRTVYVEWVLRNGYRFGLKEFHVKYNILGSKISAEQIVYPDFSDGSGPNNVTLTDLELDVSYEIRVYGLSKSLYSETLIPGNPSEPNSIFVTLDCENQLPSFYDMYLDVWTVSLGLIVFFAIVSLVVCCVYLIRRCGFCLFTRRRNRDRYYQGKEETGISIHEFPQHVADSHADGDLGFSREYEEIQQAEVQVDLTSVASQHPDNKLKNRYLNILAYDHTRVRFNTDPGEENSLTEYINANFIDGYGKTAAYIGTQGPLPATFAAFWQMVWEQNVYIIIMITNLIERGRRKCDMYWPNEDTDIHGNISITIEKEQPNATYTLRTFRLRCILSDNKKGNERVVFHFQYTNWPDHGTPDHALPILRFINKSSSANPPDGGPIVVHCSAGVGRTGAYIVLDSMLKMIKYSKKVDLFNFLKHIRTQRNFLVQTEEQYIFLNDAVVEAIECGETCIHQSYIQKYFNSLNSKSKDGNSLAGINLENQYKMATSFTPMEFHASAAYKNLNVPKNGANPIVPMDSFRVHLTPKPGRDGSDYVNASWFVGYYRLHEYIVAGAPCDYSLFDFWQLMWDHSVQTAVIFIDFEDEENVPFWPPEGEALCGETYKLSFAEKGKIKGVVYRDFTMQAVSEEFEWTLRIFFYPNWPRCCSSIVKTFDAIYQVLDWNEEHNGPIVLIDTYGTTQAATFCVLATVLCQLLQEGYGDVYTYFKLYHLFRPGCWQSSADLRFLYEAFTALVKKIPPTKVPTVAPYPPAMGLTPNITVNGRPWSYNRCRGNSASFDSVEDGLVTPEMESMYPSALQVPCITEIVNETKVDVELIENDVISENSQLEEEDGIAEDAV